MLKQQKKAWDHLVKIMARENNMTDNLGVESIDWQIGNWTNDTTMELHNERLYEEGIGKPLPNRTTIVISTTKRFEGENCLTARTLEEAMELARDKGIYIAGGVRLYEEALPFVEKMHITEIDLDVEGDTYFPNFEKEQFVKEANDKHEGEITYTYVTYTRR